MSRLFILIWKDFKRKWKNPAVIIGFMMIPLLFTFIFGLVFGSSGEEILPRIPVLVVDHDKSIVSSFVTTAMSQGELKNIIEITPEESEEKARQLLSRGKFSALLILPEKFGEKVLDGLAVEILCLKNPSERFLPRVVEEITDSVALILSSLQSVFSQELAVIRGFISSGAVPDASLAQLSIQVRDRIEGLSKYVFPPIIALKKETISEDSEEEAPSLTVHSYILPAMSIMFLLFICNVVLNDVLEEKESGTLLRMSVTPITIRHFIWSKICTAVGIGSICSLVIISLGMIIFSIQWGNLLFVLLIVLCLNILIAGFIAFLYSFVKTENQAGALLSTVILVMSLLGGSMVPVENFPVFVQKIAKLTLNYWGLQAFRISITDGPFASLLPILVGMTVAGVCLSLIGSLLLKNRLSRGLLK